VLGFSVLTQAKQVKSRIGISTQETAVAPNLTVRENLAFIAGIYGMDARRAREAAIRRSGNLQWIRLRIRGQRPFPGMAAPAEHCHGADYKAAGAAFG
jgi:ABC-type multidrug transport system ATPase subunit